MKPNMSLSIITTQLKKLNMVIIVNQCIITVTIEYYTDIKYNTYLLSVI